MMKHFLHSQFNILKEYGITVLMILKKRLNGEYIYVSGERWLESREVIFWQSLSCRINPYYHGFLESEDLNIAIFIEYRL